MITRRTLRSVAVAATVVALALSALALPAAAKGPKPGRGPAVAAVKKAAEHGKSATAKTRSTSAKGKSAEAKTRGKSATKGKSAQAKQRKAARVKATGTVVAVGTDTITVAVKGGNKALRGTEAVFTVAADARIRRDDVDATLAELLAGDHVAVDAVRADGALVASRLNASSPEPVVDEPTEDVTDIVTEDPTETVTQDPTEDPTETVTQDPIEDPTEDTTETVTDEPTEDAPLAP